MGKKRSKNKKAVTRPQPVRDKNKRHLLALAIMAVSVFLAYSNSLNGTWAMDDVVANKPVGINDIHDVIGFRKIAYLTFSLNRHFFPFSPASFRLFNIFLHILNASLVYLLAYKTVFLMLEKSEGQPVREKPASDRENVPGILRDRAFFAALLSSLIFALHPLNINAVAYIIQRMTSLAAFFVLLSLLCYIYASEAKKIKALLLYACSVASLLLGIFSKENAVLAAPLIILYDYVFISRFNLRIFAKKTFAVLAAGMIGVGAASYFLEFHHTFVDLVKLFLNLNQPLTEQRMWMAVDAYWTPLQHLLTEFRVVSRYIFLIFLPVPGFLVFDWWGFPVSKGLTEPITTLTSMLFVLSLLIFSVWRIKRYPLLCFGILWYFISISLESFFAIGADLYFEHRNYLPVSGLFVGIAGQTAIALKTPINKKVMWSTVAIVVITLGSLTFARNFVWRDSVTLWGDALKKNPSNIRAMMSVGNAWLEVPEFNKAKYYYKEAVAASIRDRMPHSLNGAVYRLGLLYLFERNVADAGRLIESVDKIIESSYNIRILKGFYKAVSGDIEGALRLYNEALPEARGPDITAVYTLMGDAFREKGMWDAAIGKYNGALANDESFAAAYYGIGMAYLSKRDTRLASEYIDKALYLEPNNVLALSDKAELMLITKAGPENAFAYAQRAVSKAPPFYQPYLTMGNVLIVLGREREAEEYYKKAFEKNSPAYMVDFSKARAYYIKGDVAMSNRYLAELRSYKDLPENIKGIIK